MSSMKTVPSALFSNRRLAKSRESTEKLQPNETEACDHAVPETFASNTISSSTRTVRDGLV
jgi:hypothetical protein